MVGALVRCAYHGGDLVKRITMIDAPHQLEFDVVEQRLGVERCIQTYGGSYRVERCGPETRGGSADQLPRISPATATVAAAETVLMRQLHKHILHGIEGAVSKNDRRVGASAKGVGELR